MSRGASDSAGKRRSWGEELFAPSAPARILPSLKQVEAYLTHRVNKVKVKNTNELLPPKEVMRLLKELGFMMTAMVPKPGSHPLAVHRFVQRLWAAFGSVAHMQTEDNKWICFLPPSHLIPPLNLESQSRVAGGFITNEWPADLSHMFLYGNSLTKLGLKARFSKVNPENLCIMCWDENELTKSIPCKNCGQHLCWSCQWDLATLSEAKEETVGPFAVGEFLCPNCRTKSGMPLQLVALCLHKDMLTSVTDYSDAKKALILRYAKESTEILPFVLPQLEKGACAKCSKKFWDKREFKKAPKCEGCRKAAYCSKTCRRKHAKVHKALCSGLFAKPKAKAKKKRKPMAPKKRRKKRRR